MVSHRMRILFVLTLSAFVFSTLSTKRAYSQDGGTPVAGVIIDPNGILKLLRQPQTLQQQKAWAKAKKALLPHDLARFSELRKVSLTRLEAAVSESLKNNSGLTNEMKYLAGLTRITHIFFYPESNDIVIAGPAEGFAQDASGRAVGLDTGRAVLELEDLIVALRAYPPAGDKTNVISVSIDPTAEGLANMQKYIVQNSRRVRQGNASEYAEGMRRSMGYQTITFQGVSPKTHFAQVLLEADYRMKLIGIGLETPPVKIPSYVSKASSRDVSRNGMQRWYFMPNYECVRVSDDELAMELIGDGVKLVGENEVVNAAGVRKQAGSTNRASQAFVTTFTKKYPQLAARSPVYAQLRNLIDLSIAAAFIQEMDYYSQAGWEMKVFGDESVLAVEVHNEPKQLETAINVIWKGNTLMTPIGGGVNIQPRQAIASGNLLYDEDGQLKDLRTKIEPEVGKNKHWWWD